ncbi:MAG: AIR synthase-related protein, partial [Pseudomonadota bacterium]
RLPPVFRWLAEQGGLDEAELLQTFNAGIGMVVVTSDAAAVRAALEAAGETVFDLGSLEAGAGLRYRGTLL